MSVKHLTIFALAVCLLVSCKKNSGSNAKPDPNRLKMYIETDTNNGVTIANDTSYVTYDNDNRLTSVTSSTVRLVYAYQSRTATLDAYQYNKFAEHEIYFLNGAYTTDSTFEYFPFTNPTSPWIVTIDTATEGYRYKGGLLTTKLSYSYSSFGAFLGFRYDYTYDNDGNLIKEVQSDVNTYANSNFNMIYTFTYTSYPVNVILSPAFAPQQANYLPATETETYGSGAHGFSSNFAYVFDSSGRLTRQTITEDNGYVGMTTYVYE